MHSEQTRNDSPRHFSHDEHPTTHNSIGDPTRSHDYFQPAYVQSERFSNTTNSANYAGDQFLDRNVEQNASLGSSATYDPSNSIQSSSSYTFMPAPLHPAQGQMQASHAQFPVPSSRAIHDLSGQSCPPGGRPRVSTTIWEDEGTLCFQVEADQVTVARREDNNMINGTKLLNVAQMSRGKRDGILKNEAVRHVIKVGSMHLKGVWIPFDRALELANKNHVTDLLYPLFVQDIKRFLYHPANYARTQAVLAAATHRQAQQGQPGAELLHEQQRPPMDRSLSMPTPLDRSLSMLTPPSSASTNGDYWAAQGNGHPISDTHGRAHSLPGTPATTPPAPAFASNGMQSQYAGAYSEPRATAGGNRYGQQPDMQRSYQHSRTTSLMSYQEEDMSTVSSTHSIHGDQHYNSGIQHLAGQHAGDHSRYPSQSSFAGLPDRPYGVASHASTYAPSSMRSSVEMRGMNGGHQISHSRGQSRSSVKVFNTPNLTTQLSRRSDRTPNPSPNKSHSRQASTDTNNQASLWVQQQQQLSYNTPQQPSRGHSRQQSTQLPQIYEETPSCRMAYQLHGQGRPVYSNQAEMEQKTMVTGSPVQSQLHNADGTHSPLNGKKKRDRVVSETNNFYQAQEERQESLTPPPIQRIAYEESPKRRRSVRTGTHSRSGSVFDY